MTTPTFNAATGSETSYHRGLWKEIEIETDRQIRN